MTNSSTSPPGRRLRILTRELGHSGSSATTHQFINSSVVIDISIEITYRLSIHPSYAAD
ncbi:unnamed protein product [Musa acuminata subsp. malaccensis]|uniref:(wild Malaysian banana) hypothetical protein n=1 Tax=Musa acuminata subsp. malaccensis TaxID=214687 RepID=A0A804IQQ1_MUSAM|nr:unnamed protein product [Musa acuminata subsp. malaccensis]